MVSFAPTEDEEAARELAHRIADDALRPAAGEAEAARAAPEPLVRIYDDAGLRAVDWPEDAGGLGLFATTRFLVEEELAWGCAGLASALGRGLAAAAAVAELGTDVQVQAVLEGHLASGGALALALEEADRGAPLGHIVTRARRDGERVLVTGEKRQVAHAASADTIVVFARLDDAPGFLGVRAILVPRDAAGLTIGRADARSGLLAVRSHDLRLEGVEVPASAVLGDPEAAPTPRAMDRFLARTWLLGAARLAGVARAALEYATGFAEERTAFGRPIGSFQGIAFKISDMAMELEGARLLGLRAAAALDRGRDDALALAAEARVHLDEVAGKVAIDAVQVLGGAGFMEDYPCAKWMRDARALAFQGGLIAARRIIAGERALGPEGGAGAPLDPASAFAAWGAAFGSA